MYTIPKVQLNADTFLFSCYEADTARTKKNGSFNSHLRFEPFLLGDFQLPAKPDIKKLRTQVTDILKHHFFISPQFRRKEDVNNDTISFFTIAITTLFADLEALFRIYTGAGLVKIPADQVEFSGSYPFLRAALLKFQTYAANSSAESEPFELFPLSISAEDDDGNDQKLVFASEVWDILSEGIYAHFPDHSEAIMSYAFWKYQTIPERELIDWRVRPPVGDLFFKAFKGMMPRGDRFGSPRSGGGGGRSGERSGPGGKGSDRGGKPSSGGAGGRGTSERGASAPSQGMSQSTRKNFEPQSQEPQTAQRGSGTGFQAAAPAAADERAPRKALQPRAAEDGHRTTERADRNDRSGSSSERGPREKSHRGGGRSERFEGRPGGNEGPHLTSDDLLQVALDEVRQMATRFKKDSTLNEIALKPANSFVRREQHTLAIELGFETESRGEGRLRTVYLKRAGQA